MPCTSSLFGLKEREGEYEGRKRIITNFTFFSLILPYSVFKAKIKSILTLVFLFQSRRGRNTNMEG